MQNIWVWIVVAIIVIAGGLWWWQGTQVPTTGSAPTSNVETGTGMPVPNGQDSGTGAEVNVNVNVETEAPLSARVVYDGSSFSPSAVTIKKGGTVTFTSTGGDMWVASGPHPAHTGYSGTERTAHCPDTAGTAFDQCAAGTSFPFTFQKSGKWPYHDHLNASAFGSVTVVQ